MFSDLSTTDRCTVLIRSMWEPRYPAGTQCDRPVEITLAYGCRHEHMSRELMCQPCATQIESLIMRRLVTCEICRTTVARWDGLLCGGPHAGCQLTSQQVPPDWQPQLEPRRQLARPAPSESFDDGDWYRAA